MKQPDLGKKILKLRLEKGLTQGELAEKCGLSLRTIQRIELAEVTPRSYTLKLIFSYLEYDFYSIFRELPEKKSKNVFEIKFRPEPLYKSVLELFNFQRNSMKKVSFISMTVILISMGMFLIHQESKAQTIRDWFKAGSKPASYKVELDRSTFKTGESSAFIESSEEKIQGFGTLMQSCSAQNYLGKRIKMTAYIKSENVAEWAGMWLRVDSKQNYKSLSFDNMMDRPIRGSNDWKKYEIILDVPEESGTLNFGVLLSGTGKVWLDDISFDIVDNQTVITSTQRLLPEKPSNIDFEKN